MAYRKFHKAMSLLERVLCFVRHGADPGVYSTAEGWRCKRCLLIEALVIGEAAVNDDYRRPCGQVPFETAHKFKMAAFRKIRAMIAQGEGYGRE